MWLGRSARGQGLGAAALRELLNAAAAAGMRTVVAETTPGNAGAISVLRKCGAQLREDGGEMLEVVGLEINRDIGEIGRAPRHADIVDVAVVLGDHLRNLRQ